MARWWTWKNPRWRGCLMLAAIALALSPLAHARRLPAQAPTASTARPSIPADLCFDTIFYWALPGKTNYCLGMKHWRAGDYDDALQLLKLAAGWGNKSAQYTLGLIYYNGHHVAADPALGMAWLKLADQRHDDAGIARAMHAAMHWATPTQRAQADRLFDKMRDTYGDEVAAARAWHHLQHWWLSHHGGLFFRGACQMLSARQAYYAGLAGAQLGLPSVSMDKNNHPVWQAVGCLPIEQKRKMVEHAAAVYFHGWMGTVDVGPLKQVPAGASSTDR